jgi:hypothetical protein
MTVNSDAERDFRWAGVSRSMLVDVYHSGRDEKRAAAPFCFVLSIERLPAHPYRKGDDAWQFWKRVPLNSIAVDVHQALSSIAEFGFYVQ